MPVRITTDATKIGYVVACSVGAPLLLLLAAPVLGSAELVILAYGLYLGVIAFAVRTFRGENELLAPPRPWWRMTARPRSGYIFGALFSLEVVLALFTGALDAWSSAAGFLLELLLAALFIGSSIRLSRERADRVDGAPTVA
ncbi:MAG: hypothetical protein ACOH2F_19655 [Cellulomonas sp.]